MFILIYIDRLFHLVTILEEILLILDDHPFGFLSAVISVES